MATAIVVEDDRLQRDALAMMLEEIDFQVIQCEDGDAAALAVESLRPSWLITDVNLIGKMDGLDLAHLARQSDGTCASLWSREAVCTGRCRGVL